MDVEWRFSGDGLRRKEARKEGSGRKEHVIPEGLARPNFRASKFQ